MEITIVSNYYPPEIGAASSRIKYLSESLSEKFNYVNVVCPMPNYPEGRVFENYRGLLYRSKILKNIRINRYWIYPSNSKSILDRILSMLSFSVSLWFYAFKFNSIRKSKWIIIQNSPLLVSFSSIILFKYIFRRKIALNVSDLWPLTALELGAVKKNKFYSFLEFLEKFNYKSADLIMGQSKEIIEHISYIADKKMFLYRNLPKNINTKLSTTKNKKFKIVYAGLMGVAQGIYDIVKNVDFKVLDVEFHLYGSGNELKLIKNYIKSNPNSNIFYNGSISKEELLKALPKFQASIVPLITYIKGAVPSKIFELIGLGIPILYLGKGEAANLINDWKVGYVCKPKEFKALEVNIKKLLISNSEYMKLKKNCLNVSKTELDLKKQINKLINLLK